MWRLERDWGIDIEDEYLWGYKHLQSLEKIFQEFASFLGSDQWKGILAESAKLGGRDKFLVRGTLADWDVSEGGICTTGCNVFGEVRFNLGLSFSDQNPGFGGLGDWYRNPLGRGQLTMAHEFAHVLLAVRTEIQDIYNSTSGWDTSSNSWVGRDGMIPSPTEHLVQLIALYVTPGNTWGEVEASSLGDTGPITPYDQWYVGNFIPYSFNE